MYSLEKGNEESFKALSGSSFGILHIATHGFFETRETSVNLPALRSTNPMSLSGLILSNGNNFLNFLLNCKSG